MHLVHKVVKGLSVEELVMKASGGVFNNAAQVWNHTFYWNSLSQKYVELMHLVHKVVPVIRKPF
jgi:superoxide dismutase